MFFSNARKEAPLRLIGSVRLVASWWVVDFCGGNFGPRQSENLIT